jgi:pimeloyl-ACP methyl ester carboxylesterase
MLRQGMFLKASLAAAVACVTACMSPSDNSAVSEQAQSVSTPTPIDPGLAPGTVVVPLPHFDQQPRAVNIPNATGFLRGQILGRGDEAIVIINGGPGLNSAFVTRLHQGMADALPGRRIVRYDQRGLGGSSPTTADQQTITGTVDDVESIRKFLGVRKIHLVGQSFGGFVAGAYASTHPNNVASIAFVDPLPPVAPDSPFVTQGFAAINAYYSGLIAAGILLPSPDDLPQGEQWNRIIGVYFANPLVVPIEITAPTTEQVFAISDPINDDWSANGAALVANLNNVRVPVLVVGGGISAFGPTFAQGAATAMSASNPKLVTIAGAGHLTWSDKPAETFGALRAFFDGCAHAN